MDSPYGNTYPTAYPYAGGPTTSDQHGHTRPHGHGDACSYAASYRSPNAYPLAKHRPILAVLHGAAR